MDDAKSSRLAKAANLQELLDRAASRGRPRGSQAVLYAARAEAHDGFSGHADSDPPRTPLRSRLVLAAVLAAALVGVAVVGVRLRSSTAATTSTAAALRSERVNARLAWVDQHNSQGGTLVIADADGGPVRETTTALGCQSCPVVRIGQGGYTTHGGHVQRVDPATGQVQDLGAGQGVFSAADARSLYVVTALELDVAKLEEWSLTGQRIGGPWNYPVGYGPPETARAVVGGVLVQTQENSARHTLAVWDPIGGGLRTIGHDRLVVDTLSDRASSTTVAWLPADCSSKCGLRLTDTRTGRTTSVAVPKGYSTFFGGGAFSPTGSQLATFVSRANAPSGPQADLAVIDLRHPSAARILGNSTVPLGEPFGFAVWTPNGRWLLFGGNGGALRINRAESSDAVLTHLPAFYSLVGITAPSAAVPNGAVAYQKFVAGGQPLAEKACDAWPQRPDVAVGLARKATDHDLMFTVLREHMETSPTKVLDDCRWIRQGAFRAHVND